MNLVQIEWVLEKALHIVRKYKGKNLEDKDYEEAVAYMRKVYEDSKKNEFCKKIMHEVLNSLDS